MSRAPKGYVTFGVASRHSVEPHTARTMLEATFYDREYGGQHLHPRRFQLWVNGSGFVTNARNELVKQFLKMDDDEPSEWLVMLDDDQLYPQHLFDLLIASVDAAERPIVGLPVWRFIDTDTTGQVRITHNVYDLAEDGSVFEWPDPFPENTVLQVAAVGTGCLMMHRSALERMRDVAMENGLGPTFCWFRQTVQGVVDADGKLISDHVEGEDVHFCRLAGVAGIPVCINTSVTLEHVKHIRLKAAGYASI